MSFFAQPFPPFFTTALNTHHLKLSFQLNPPHVMSEAVTYSKLSSEMTSMIGHTTAFRFTAISASSGSSQPSVHSQWASRKVITEPFTFFAPKSLEGKKKEKWTF